MMTNRSSECSKPQTVLPRRYVRSTVAALAIGVAALTSSTAFAGGWGHGGHGGGHRGWHGGHGGWHGKFRHHGFGFGYGHNGYSFFAGKYPYYRFVFGKYVCHKHGY